MQTFRSTPVPSGPHFVRYDMTLTAEQIPGIPLKPTSKPQFGLTTKVLQGVVLVEFERDRCVRP